MKKEKNKNIKRDITLKEAQFLIKHIENGSLNDLEKNNDKENTQRLILKLIEEFGELAESIRKNMRYDGKNIKGTIEEEVFDIFYYILAIANEFDIDMENIFIKKDEINQKKYERTFSLEEAREVYKNKIIKK